MLAGGFEVGCIIAAVLFAASAVFAVETWRVEELSFEAAKDYTSGGGDAVLMDVAFVHSRNITSHLRRGHKRLPFWSFRHTY